MQAQLGMGEKPVQQAPGSQRDLCRMAVKSVPCLLGGLESLQSAFKADLR